MAINTLQRLQIATANFFEDAEQNEGNEASCANVDPSEDSLYGQNFTASFPSTEKSRAVPAKNSRFGTIPDLIRHHDSSSDDEGQAFYAGGSVRSGQQILGPRKLKVDEFVKSIFKSAKKHGAEEMTEVGCRDDGPTNEGLAFSGTGYRLGEGHGPLETVSGPSFQAPSQPVSKVLRMWKTGFSLDDGELRLYNDPENKRFLDSISRGEIPQELWRQYRQKVSLSMEDRRTEEFVRNDSKLQAFAGQGYMLGSPTPVMMNIEHPGPSSQASGAETNVDASKPVTTIQLRLSDGQRMVEKFNLHHTVGDIRRHIIMHYPRYAETTFVLMTIFPSRDLSDDAQTLEDAQLSNAVIVQKMT